MYARQMNEIEERQQRRLVLLERQTADTERLRNLRQSQSFERRLASEMHDRRTQEVMARRYYDQHVQQLRAQKLAQKAEEERVSCTCGMGVSTLIISVLTIFLPLIC